MIIEIGGILSYLTYKTFAFDNIQNPVISFFIACYNERGGIINSIRMVIDGCQELNISYEIIVGDDCSKDGSVEIVKDFIDHNHHIPILFFINDENKGLAQNYIEASFLGKGEHYRLVCGDDVEYKNEFKRVISCIGKADMIIPILLDIKRKSFIRKILSKMYILIINSVSGYKMRYYNALPVLRRFDVMRWHTNYRGFGFQADMIVRLLEQKRSYYEIEIHAHEREYGESKALNIMNVLSICHTILDIFIRRFGTFMYSHISKKKKLCLNTSSKTQYTSQDTLK